MASPEPPVLIVDDDVDIRETLTEILEGRGFEIVSAANGLEALKLLGSLATTPSAILLDLMMPIMDGYEFLEQVAKDPALAAIPVAVITAGHRVDRERLGTDTLIVPKPIDVPRLVTLLRELRSARPSE